MKINGGYYMITFRQKGDFSKTNTFFGRLKNASYLKRVDKYGKDGVSALSAATPVDTGLTAASWRYDIEQNESSTSIVFSNSNVQNGIPIAVILQNGHATKNGGWVQGVDYINPAIHKVFDNATKDVWEEVTKK